MLTIYLDFKSPASYLALEPTLDMAQETGAHIDWLPFSVRPFSVPEEQADETVGERHRRVRAIAQRDTYLQYSAVQGREMQFSKTPAGSDLALAAMAGIEGDPVPFMRAAFAAYWIEQVDLDNAAVIVALLQSVGADIPDLKSAREKLALIRDRANESGIFESPSYVIQDQLFVGREHLPWIKSLIVAESSQ